MNDRRVALNRSGPLAGAISAAVTAALFIGLVLVNRALTRTDLVETSDPPESVAERPPPVVVVAVRPPTLVESPIRQFVPELASRPDPGIQLQTVSAGIVPEHEGLRRWFDGVSFGVELAWRPDELDAPPIPLQQIAPVYPPGEKARGNNGWAVLSFVVDETGAVRNAVVDSASSRAFGDSALAAVYAWRFSPGMKDERAVRTRLMQRFNFSLER